MSIRKTDAQRLRRERQIEATLAILKSIRFHVEQIANKDGPQIELVQDDSDIETSAAFHAHGLMEMFYVFVMAIMTTQYVSSNLLAAPESLFLQESYRDASKRVDDIIRDDEGGQQLVSVDTDDFEKNADYFNSGTLTPNRFVRDEEYRENNFDVGAEDISEDNREPDFDPYDDAYENQESGDDEDEEHYGEVYPVSKFQDFFASETVDDHYFREAQATVGKLLARDNQDSGVTHLRKVPKSYPVAKASSYQDAFHEFFNGNSNSNSNSNSKNERQDTTVRADEYNSEPLGFLSEMLEHKFEYDIKRGGPYGILTGAIVKLLKTIDNADLEVSLSNALHTRKSLQKLGNLLFRDVDEYVDPITARLMLRTIDAENIDRSTVNKMWEVAYSHSMMPERTPLVEWISSAPSRKIKQIRLDLEEPRHVSERGFTSRLLEKNRQRSLQWLRQLDADADLSIVANENIESPEYLQHMDFFRVINEAPEAMSQIVRDHALIAITDFCQSLSGFGREMNLFVYTTDPSDVTVGTRMCADPQALAESYIEWVKSTNPQDNGDNWAVQVLDELTFVNFVFEKYLTGFPVFQEATIEVLRQVTHSEPLDLVLYKGLTLTELIIKFLTDNSEALNLAVFTLVAAYFVHGITSRSFTLLEKKFASNAKFLAVWNKIQQWVTYFSADAFLSEREFDKLFHEIESSTEYQMDVQQYSHRRLDRKPVSLFIDEWVQVSALVNASKQARSAQFVNAVAMEIGVITGGTREILKYSEHSILWIILSALLPWRLYTDSGSAVKRVRLRKAFLRATVVGLKLVLIQREMYLNKSASFAAYILPGHQKWEGNLLNPQDSKGTRATFLFWYAVVNIVMYHSELPVEIDFYNKLQEYYQIPVNEIISPEVVSLLVDGAPDDLGQSRELSEYLIASRERTKLFIRRMFFSNITYTRDDNFYSTLDKEFIVKWLGKTPLRQVFDKRRRVFSEAELQALQQLHDDGLAHNR